MINLIKSTRVDYLYSYIYYNSLAKDRDGLITKLNYQKRSLDHELNIVKQNIADGAALIASYKNSNILINKQSSNSEDTESQDITTKSITDYYNSLILKQSDFFASKNNTELELNNLNDKIRRFSSGYASPGKLASVDQEIASVNNICRQLYDLVRDHAIEIRDSEAYRNSFITEINAYYIGGFFNSANVKSILMGGVIGLLVGFVIWFGNSLMKEIRDSEAESKNRVQENKV